MERHEAELAAAYVRGAAKKGILTLPADCTGQAGFERMLEAGNAAGLRMYHFKKKDMLPRVQAVMGFLKGVQPESLLDVGSGRGVFLFPFLKEFPWVPVTSLDLLPHRVEMLDFLRLGGVENLTAMQADICTWNAPDGSFDVVTLLEVLEHIPQVETAVQNALRLAKRFVVVTVPSKPDDNPEHIHLLTKDILTKIFTDAGCQKLRFDGVYGHLVMIASKE